MLEAAHEVMEEFRDGRRDAITDADWETIEPLQTAALQKASDAVEAANKLDEWDPPHRPSLKIVEWLDQGNLEWPDETPPAKLMPLYEACCDRLDKILTDDPFGACAFRGDDGQYYTVRLFLSADELEPDQVKALLQELEKEDQLASFENEMRGG